MPTTTPPVAVPLPTATPHRGLYRSATLRQLDRLDTAGVEAYSTTRGLVDGWLPEDQREQGGPFPLSEKTAGLSERTVWPGVVAESTAEAATVGTRLDEVEAEALAALEAREPVITARRLVASLDQLGATTETARDAAAALVRVADEATRETGREAVIVTTVETLHRIDDEFTLTANAGRLYTLGGSIVVTVGELPDGVTGYVTGPLTVFRTEITVSSTTAPDTNRHVAVAERTVAPAVEQVMHGGQWHPAIKVTEGGGASV